MEAEYITVTEVAKLIRKALKKLYPDTKFNVRSEKYSMCTSIRINWKDGPTAKMVYAICDQFTGSGFDGSIDLKYSWTSWLLPDGSTMIADCRGTVGSKGCVEPMHNDKPHPDAKLVRFSNDHIDVRRDMSPEFAERALAAAERKFGKLDLKINLHNDGTAYLAGNMDHAVLARQVTSRFMSLSGKR